MPWLRGHLPLQRIAPAVVDHGPQRGLAVRRTGAAEETPMTLVPGANRDTLDGKSPTAAVVGFPERSPRVTRPRRTAGCERLRQQPGFPRRGHGLP